MLDVEWGVCGDQANPEYRPGYLFCLYSKISGSEKKPWRPWEGDLIGFVFQSPKLLDSKIENKNKNIELT